MLCQVLEKLLDTVKKAKTSLSRLDEKATFPQKECDTRVRGRQIESQGSFFLEWLTSVFLSQGFTPELPDDLIIEFYVNRAAITVSVIALHSQNKLLNRLIQTGTVRT